jgi:hypothetical protein
LAGRQNEFNSPFLIRYLGKISAAIDATKTFLRPVTDLSKRIKNVERPFFAFGSTPVGGSL